MTFARDGNTTAPARSACPRCGTPFDRASGLCGRCGWSAPYLAERPPASERAPSYGELYRGTIYDSRPATPAGSPVGIARGRIFVLLALGVTASLFALVVAVLSR